MSEIRCIYETDPGFPATSQHPDAVRYIVPPYIVDAIGGEPTLAEINAVLNPSSGSESISATEARTRADALADLQHSISTGASQPIINAAIVNLIGQS